jgi:hypothetical protein
MLAQPAVANIMIDMRVVARGSRGSASSCPVTRERGKVICKGIVSQDSGGFLIALLNRYLTLEMPDLSFFLHHLNKVEALWEN